MIAETEEHADDIGIPLRSLVLPQDGLHPVVVHAFPALAGVRHRVPGIAGGHDAGPERDVVAPEPVRITAAVDPLVVSAHERRRTAKRR